jgi:mRNA interferase MazF
MLIQPGAIFWVKLPPESNEEIPIPHPHVVMQENSGDNAASGTVVACAITSNIKRISLPGNVLLEGGEANLPKPSVVEVAKIVTLEKNQLGEYIGTLAPQRVEQILAGLRFVERLFLSRQVV